MRPKVSTVSMHSIVNGFSCEFLTAKNISILDINNLGDTSEKMKWIYDNNTGMLTCLMNSNTLDSTRIFIVKWLEN